MKRSDELILKIGKLNQLEESQEQVRRRKEEESLALYEELKGLGNLKETKEWEQKIEEILQKVNRLEQRWSDVERELYRKIENLWEQIRKFETE